MRLDETLQTHARRQPNTPAVIVPAGVSLSYESLASRASQIARSLREAGVAPGRHVTLALPNGPEMLAAFFGAVQVGVVAPVAPSLRETEFEACLRHQNPAAVVALEDSTAIQVARRQGLAVIELPANILDWISTDSVQNQTPAPANPKEFLVEPRPEDPTDGGGALLMHTSGTTSLPKKFVLTHRNLSAAIQLAARHLDLDPGDRYLNVMPLYHAHGLMRCLWTIGTGGTIICPPEFDAALFFDWIEDFQPTWYSAVPAIHQAVLAEAPRHQAALDRRRLRFAITNSAPMPFRVAQALEKELGVPILELYGCSETCSATIAPLGSKKRRPGSVGVPIIDLAVMNESGRLLAAGVTGEIVMRGDTVTAGYLDNDEANVSAFSDGWFRSGDLGYVDEDGFVFVTGRIKEIINRGGEKVAPLEVDVALLSHPAVAQAATFGVPHPTLGEEVAAAVVLADGANADADEIRSFVTLRLSPQKAPRQILITGEIPKNRTGKVVRRELAAVFGLDFSTGTEWRSERAAASTPVEQTLVDIWAGVLGLDEVGVTDNLFQLGGNSLTAMQIAARVVDTLDVDLPAVVFFEHPTIAELAKIIDHETALAG